MLRFEILAATALILGAIILGLGINAIEQRYESLRNEMGRLETSKQLIARQLEHVQAENQKLKIKMQFLTAGNLSCK